MKRRAAVAASERSNTSNVIPRPSASSSKSYLFACSASACCLLLILSASSLQQTQAFAAESTSSSGSSTSNNNGGSVTHKVTGGPNGGGSSSSSSLSQSRQSGLSAAGSVLSALGSLVPGLITNVAPLVLLFGLGAMMMPQLGMSAMGLLRESRRSANDQPNVQQPATASLFPFNTAFGGQYAARPMQTSPQDIYYFTKRSLPSLMSSEFLQDVLHRVVRAIENADKRYN